MINETFRAHRKVSTVAISAILAFALAFAGTLPTRAQATSTSTHTHDAQDACPTPDTCELSLDTDNGEGEGEVDGEVEGEGEAPDGPETDAATDAPCELNAHAGDCTEHEHACEEPACSEEECANKTEQSNQAETNEAAPQADEDYTTKMYVGGSFNAGKTGKTGSEFEVPKGYTYPIVCYKEHTHKITLTVASGSADGSYTVVTQDNDNGTVWVRAEKSSSNVFQASCNNDWIKFKITNSTTTSDVSIVTNSTNAELFYFDYNGSNADYAENLMPLPASQSIKVGNFSSSTKSSNDNYAILFIKSDNTKLISTLSGTYTTNNSESTSLKWCTCDSANDGLLQDTKFAKIWEKAKERGAIAHTYVALSSSNSNTTIMPMVTNASPSLAVSITTSITGADATEKTQYRVGDTIKYEYTVKKSDSLGGASSTLTIAPTITTTVNGAQTVENPKEQSSEYEWTGSGTYTVTEADKGKTSLSISVAASADYTYELKTNNTYNCKVNSTSKASRSNSTSTTREALYTLKYEMSVAATSSTTSMNSLFSTPQSVEGNWSGDNLTVDSSFDTDSYYLDDNGHVWQFSGWKKGDELYTDQTLEITEDTTLKGEWTSANDAYIEFDSFTYNGQAADNTKAITALGKTNFTDVAADEITFHAGTTTTRANQLTEAPKDPGTYTVKATWNTLDAKDKSTTKQKEATTTFTISRIDLNAVDVNGLDDVVYTGSAITPELELVYSGKRITSGRSFTATFTNNTDVGTATVTIEGIDKFEGTVTKTFQITPARLEASMFSALADVVYTGLEHLQEITGTGLAGEPLELDKHYENVTWQNNVEASTDDTRASVTVSGMGNYTGNVTLDFAIAKASGNDIVDPGSLDKVYDGQDVDLTLTPVIPDSKVEYLDPETGEWTTTPPSISEVGSWTVPVRVTHPNYATVEREINFTISPAPVTPSGTTTPADSNNGEGEGEGEVSSSASASASSDSSAAQTPKTISNTSAGGAALAKTGDTLLAVAFAGSAIALLAAAALAIARKKQK